MKGKQYYQELLKLRIGIYIGIKKVLLIDDLFRSGSTLNEIASVLYKDAGVQNVYVVTLTKTRVNK